MKNVIQNYAWGSKTSLNQLFAISNPESAPQAEMWMGAHPNGCSLVTSRGISVKLSELIANNPQHYLGEHTANAFGELPYLFKILAAEQALSIQVHPSKAQAETGYAKEQQLGVPLTASHRNYKDPNHKPELVYALTQYQAMNGFRPIEEIIENFTQLAIPELNWLLEALTEEPNSHGLASFFSGILSLQGEQKEMALTMLMVKAKLSNEPVYGLISELEKQYPNDVGLFAPLMLNVITLQPGEAMYLDAQTPHAYLHGTGLEIMANSDNVLRAGLTPKHIDIEELVSCTQFVSKPKHSLKLAPSIDAGIESFEVPVDDFKFSILHDSENRHLTTNSAEILLPLDKPMTLTHSNGETCQIAIGDSVFVAANTDNYTLSCQGRVARAYS
ncbi:mannose-6-phosphate isomerase, class I [Vibrio europaeus]|uniref:mannose-6-phosphate isomerase, class I n=1 Tax=Vibrio europaeus TaxID=300876 RepID=UPI00233EFA10|nr:mannose-6-phosphate isomerase, class I [Vibrio europaeus]MDC5822559.1 mannose-6-phosphate isomerase, class I [Vibrio europaeus]MDC5869192.1 mannose-6-phosphate isomerase, class I [Vibrio europaeus]